MHETIYTIPLTESLEQDTECPFCYLENKLEEEQIGYALGPAMMEPDHRILSNKLGYCRVHTQKMAEAKQALPFALVMDTRMDTVIAALEQAQTEKSASSRFFKKAKKANNAQTAMENLTSTCLVCDKIQHTMSKFLYTFWYLYKKEPDFRARIEKSHGFCLPHFQAVLSAAKEQAGVKDAFIDALFTLEIANLKRNKQDVTNFIKQFDYRSAKQEGTFPKNAHHICGGKLAKF